MIVESEATAVSVQCASDTTTGGKENEQELREGSNVRLGIRKASCIMYLGQTGQGPMLNVELNPALLELPFKSKNGLILRGYHGPKLTHFTINRRVGVCLSSSLGFKRSHVFI
jgi:hypothetical protein